MSHTFSFDGKDFEIREAVLGNRYCVRVFLGDTQVSPEYSATLDVGADFFAQHKDHIFSVLRKIAEDDIRTGMYLKA